MSNPSASPLRIALISQLLGAVIAFGPIVWAYPKALQMPLLIAVGQGICAALISRKLEAPAWWQPIHLCFMPGVVMASALHLPGWFYLSAFLVLLLVFWRIQESRVPLFLSNRATVETVAALLPKATCRVLDLGCGNGMVLRRLAELCPDSEFAGVEHAPIPWLWATLACFGVSNCRIRFGNMWNTRLGEFDIVYAFLSPAPMARLWDKARSEMRPGALLISNSFVIPEAGPENVVEVPGRRACRLYCYRPVPAGSQ